MALIIKLAQLWPVRIGLIYNNVEIVLIAYTPQRFSVQLTLNIIANLRTTYLYVFNPNKFHLGPA